MVTKKSSLIVILRTFIIKKSRTAKTVRDFLLSPYEQVIHPVNLKAYFLFFWCLLH